MSGAKFKIRNITTGGAWSLYADGGFDCANSDVIEVQLESLPALDVNSFTLYVVTTSKDADPLDFPGASSTSYSPSPPTAAFQITAPASGAHSWLLRGQTNGGAVVVGAGNQPDFSLNTRERILAIRTANLDLRKGIVSETGQYSSTGGWMDTQNEEVDAIDAAVGGFVLATSGSVAALADKWLIRGSGGEAKANYFEAGVIGGAAGIAATAGLVRGTRDSTLVAAAADDQLSTISVLWIGNDVIGMGEAVDTLGYEITATAGAYLHWMPGGSAAWSLVGPLMVMTAGVPAAAGEIGMDLATGRPQIYIFDDFATELGVMPVAVVGDVTPFPVTYAYQGDAITGRAANASLEIDVYLFPGDLAFDKITIVSDGVLTESDADYVTIEVIGYDMGNFFIGPTGAPFTTKTVGSGGTGSWTAKKRMPVDIDPSAFSTGGVDTLVTLKITPIGAGVVLPSFLLQLNMGPLSA